MIRVLMIGKTTESALVNLTENYIQRIQHYGQCKTTIIPALKNIQSVSIQEIKNREGELILQALDNKDMVILLDEAGKSYSSVAFAHFLERTVTLHRSIVFIIGGAYGFSSKVYEVATHQLSLSSMTFSHQIIRLIFLEQLYRAFTILNNEPYHHA